MARGGATSDSDSVNRLSVAVEIITRHAGMPPNSLGVIRMWMKALFLARPENPELFSFLLMRIIDFLDKKLALHHDFYSNDCPQLDKADDMQEDFARWEREKVSKRVAAIKHNFHSHAAEETQALLREVRENMESSKMVQNRLIEDHLRELRMEDEKLDEAIKIRQVEDVRDRVSTVKKSHEQLLRDLVRRVKLRETLNRKLTEAEKQHDAIKIDALKREVSRMHLESATAKTVEHVFNSDSEEEMARNAQTHNSAEDPAKAAAEREARKRQVAQRLDPHTRHSPAATLGTAASKIQDALARQRELDTTTQQSMVKVADARTFDSIKTGESAQQYNARKKTPNRVRWT